MSAPSTSGLLVRRLFGATDARTLYLLVKGVVTSMSRAWDNEKNFSPQKDSNLSRSAGGSLEACRNILVITSFTFINKSVPLVPPQ